MKKTIGVLLAGMLTVSCGAGSVSAVDANVSLEDMQTDTIGVVSWTQTYNSVDEMMEDADANIIGTVVSQSVEQRGEHAPLYFTHSYVEGNDGKIYDVVQTGAYVNGIAKNIPSDVSLLEVNKQYFLCLNLASYDNSNQFYLIAGGTQGLGEYDHNLNVVSVTNCDDRTLFDSMEIDVYNNNEIMYEALERILASSSRFCVPRSSDFNNLELHYEFIDFS